MSLTMIVIQTPVILYGCDVKTFYRKLEIITTKVRKEVLYLAGNGLI
jgi:hypothetical protein